MKPFAFWLSPWLLGACTGAQTMLDPAGDQARAIDGIWRLMLVVCAFMYLLVMSGLVWALLRARKKGAAGATQVGHTDAEPVLTRGLTLWVGLISVGLIVLTTVSFLVDRAVAAFGLDEDLLSVGPPQERMNAPYDTSLDATRTAEILGVTLPDVDALLHGLREQL